MIDYKKIVLDWKNAGLIALTVGTHGQLFCQGIGDGSHMKSLDSYEQVYNRFKNTL